MRIKAFSIYVIPPKCIIKMSIKEILLKVTSIMYNNLKEKSISFILSIRDLLGE